MSQKAKELRLFGSRIYDNDFQWTDTKPKITMVKRAWHEDSQSFQNVIIEKIATQNICIWYVIFETSYKLGSDCLQKHRKATEVLWPNQRPCLTQTITSHDSQNDPVGIFLFLIKVQSQIHLNSTIHLKCSWDKLFVTKASYHWCKVGLARRRCCQECQHRSSGQRILEICIITTFGDNI